VGTVDRSPLFLAALASAAVPGLDPASVEALPGTAGHQYDVAFVQDTQHRRWVVRVPRSQAAAAQMESTFGLLALLARRLPFSVPTPKGFAPLKEGGRAAIYPYLPGQTLDFTQLPAGPGLAAELGRAIAALHNADHSLFDEAGLPAYDADTYRTRRLTELDSAAATGHVPTSLLARWERALEDVALWRFAPTPTHGDLTGDQVLVVFDDEADAATGRVRALTGWEDAKVADPADDFAALATQAPAGALETVMEAYAHARSERPDPALLTRARLSAEMRTVPELMAAVGSGDQLQVERLSAHLRRLDDRLHDEEQEHDDYRRPAFAAPRSPATVLVPPELDDEADDDEELSDVTPAGTAEVAGGRDESPLRHGDDQGGPAVGDGDGEPDPRPEREAGWQPPS
jgi:macrolide phosphotransferase